LKLRRTTSQTLQGAHPGCDSPRMPPLASCTPSRIVLESCAPKSPIDRTMRPAVAKRTPVESRKATIVLQGPSAAKKVCASWVMPTIVSGKKEPTIRPRAPAFERAVVRVVGWGSGTGRDLHRDHSVPFLFEPPTSAPRGPILRSLCQSPRAGRPPVTDRSPKSQL
jgi:hypothetical protein